MFGTLSDGRFRDWLFSDGTFCDETFSYGTFSGSDVNIAANSRIERRFFTVRVSDYTCR